MQVHIDTLKVSGQGSYVSGGKTVVFDRHTVEITIGSDRRAVPCSVTKSSDNPDRDHLTIRGLALRFRTGTKVWPGTAVYWLKTGNVNNLRPNIDKFTGQHCSLVGYIDDFAGKASRSQHNAVA